MKNYDLSTIFCGKVDNLWITRLVCGVLWITLGIRRYSSNKNRTKRGGLSTPFFSLGLTLGRGSEYRFNVGASKGEVGTPLVGGGNDKAVFLQLL